MDFKTQGEAWFEGLRTRKRKPVKPGTLAVYRSYLNNWILPRLGNVEIATFGNAGMKTFAASLDTPARPLKPKSLNEIAGAVKQIIGSATNENGDQLYPRAWNHDFIDLPLVNKHDQKTPCPDKIDLARAIRQASPDMGTFWAMLGGTGLRIGEALALRIGDDTEHSGWDREKRLIFVRTQLWRGTEITPKTAAGVREVDLHSKLNTILCAHAGNRPAGSWLFQSESGGHAHESTIRKFALEKSGVQGFHAFRRFRVTYLREYGVPEDIIRYWLGHEGEGITDRYSKLAQNRELRQSWAERVGLGFETEIGKEYERGPYVKRTAA